MIERESRASRIYYHAVSLAGIAVAFYCAYRLIRDPIGYEWLILASLTILTATFTVRIPGINARISVSDTFVLTNMILFGVHAGTLTAALDGLFACFRSKTSRRRVEFAFFSVGALSLACYLAGLAFFHLIGRSPLHILPPTSLRQMLLPLASMALVLYVFNSGSVAAMVALEGGKRFFPVWRDNFLWTSMTYFTGASVAGLIALNATSISPAVLGVITPVIVIIFFTYKTYLRRVEEHISHLKELNQLHLSTVETLAMAIDAKDQVTHGHVRRVQVYARGLARSMGIVDENALRGIEAASLLHDIGKLAIPEYILNKPGDLSVSEHQKMMIHPAVGADILASIRFPYPVAEYVRYHHEYWDGTGYPEGLKGTQIPLGARILAVADCFEALTCERPYRAAFKREEALEILRSRSGKHYDPEIVAKFTEIQEDLEKEVLEIDVHEFQVEGLRAIANTARASEPAQRRTGRDLLVFQDISSTHREVFALYELAQTLGSTLNLNETLMIVAAKVQKVIPCNTCAIYLYSMAKACLRVEHALGEAAEAFKGHTIAFGDSVSGWAAAHGQPAVNADPAQELLPLREKLPVSLVNTLVYPLSFEKRTLGAISLYTTGERFKDDHLRVMETVARQAAAAIFNAMKFEETQEDAFTDRLTSLPNSRFLYLLFEEELQKAIRHRYAVTLLLMDLDGLKTINDSFGHPAGDRMLAEIAALLKSNLRSSDQVVRYAGDEFIAVMAQTSPRDAALLARRVQAAVDGYRMEVRPGKTAQVGISIGLASYPADGDTLEALMTRADQEMYRDKENRKRSSRLVLRPVEEDPRQLEFGSSALS